MKPPNAVLIAVCTLIVAGTVGVHGAPRQDGAASGKDSTKDVTKQKGYGEHFQTSDRCVACHNGLKTTTGEDISIGVAWKSTMMANSGRDPYWMAGVRRETIDHPTATKEIEDECSICHMPMMRYEAKLAGEEGQVFAHLSPKPNRLDDKLAADGVSCSVCHQITGENLGTRASFVGGFKIDEKTPAGQRHEYGPYSITPGRTTIMHSSSTFEPVENSKVIASSELCATCHTLITRALSPDGKVIGEFPEQVPYQEWLHSDYRTMRSCQSCHMPVVEEDVAPSSVFGQPRPDFARHTFVGGNFFMQRMLNAYRAELNVPSLPQELDAASNRTIEHLRSQAATVSIQDIEQHNERIEATIVASNLGGHKLPTAYPSRRAWLHVVLRDHNGKVIFESGALRSNGSIAGNDNDEDATKFEPHHREITSEEQVQVYESIMVDSDGKPTTGLLRAVRYIKDNRLLPRGFDKGSAEPDVGVYGEAARDDNFAAGGDRVRYSMATNGAEGPFQIEGELWYQPIGYRWAMNLKTYDAMEPRRFVGYFETMAPGSGVVLARATATK